MPLPFIIGAIAAGAAVAGAAAKVKKEKDRKNSEQYWKSWEALRKPVDLVFLQGDEAIRTEEDLEELVTFFSDKVVSIYKDNPSHFIDRDIFSLFWRQSYPNEDPFFYAYNYGDYEMYADTVPKLVSRYFEERGKDIMVAMDEYRKEHPNVEYTDEEICGIVYNTFYKDFELMIEKIKAKLI